MFEMYTGAPLRTARLEKVKEFLSKRGLTMEMEADYTVILYDEESNVAATGSLCGNVLKYIAVDAQAEGTGACATVVSELVSEAVRRGISHLFLYTKPENERMFSSLGFYSVARTKDALMMEDKRGGIDRFLEKVAVKNCEKPIGAVVMNCNPFTNGHKYLIETARKQVGHLYVFVVSEDAAMFSAQARFDLVATGTCGMENVSIHKSEDYLVSKATFPTYFIKDRTRVGNVQTDLDIAIFAQRIAPALGITKRFVGTEPYCAVTRAYNERMKELLPISGIELIEIERKDGISASAVRKLIEMGNIAGVKTLVPETTYEYIQGKFS